MAMEDERIIQLYFARNEEAISRTAEKYGNYCHAIAENISGSKEDAEECVNDTYLAAWNSIPPEKPAVLRTFLGRITRNLSFDLYRKKHAEKRGGGQLTLILDELEECVSGGNRPEEEWEKKELTAAIHSFLGKLSEEKRAMFLRRYWFADSVSSIADRFGMSPNAVSVSLSRLREKLRDHLKKESLL